MLVSGFYDYAVTAVHSFPSYLFVLTFKKIKGFPLNVTEKVTHKHLVGKSFALQERNSNRLRDNPSWSSGVPQRACASEKNLGSGKSHIIGSLCSNK